MTTTNKITLFFETSDLILNIQISLLLGNLYLADFVKEKTLSLIYKFMARG